MNSKQTKIELKTLIETTENEEKQFKFLFLLMASFMFYQQYKLRRSLFDFRVMNFITARDE